MVLAVDVVHHVDIDHRNDVGTGVGRVNRGKIEVGKIRGWAEVKGVGPRWWASCPHCPTKHGFTAVYTHGDAMDWVDRHLFKFHANDAFLFRVGGFGYPNKGEVRNDGR